MLKDPWLKALVALLVLIAAYYLTSLVWSIALQLADIIVMLVIAWLISFALEPVVQALMSTERFARPFAVAVVYLGLLIVLTLAVLLLIPVIALQVTQIGTNLPAYVDNSAQWIVSLQESVPRQGVAAAILAGLDYTQLARSVQGLGPAIVNNALVLATGVATVLFNLVLTLMFSFYIMLDGGKFTDALVRAVPKERQDEANYLVFSVHRAFGGFIRGQLIQAVTYGVGTAIVMMAANLSYTAVAATFAAVAMMVPFVGPILGLIPPVAISLVVHPEATWWVLVLLLALQQVVLNVLGPRVMGQSVGIHPMVVLLALLVGAKLAGIWGALFAAPVAGTIVAMVSFYRMSVDEKAEHTNKAAAAMQNVPPAP
ncbi:MAG TPA: AI-2E family transporter [Chloroflexota bacterium]